MMGFGRINLNKSPGSNIIRKLFENMTYQEYKLKLLLAIVNIRYLIGGKGGKLSWVCQEKIWNLCCTQRTILLPQMIVLSLPHMRWHNAKGLDKTVINSITQERNKVQVLDITDLAITLCVLKEVKNQSHHCPLYPFKFSGLALY